MTMGWGILVCVVIFGSVSICLSNSQNQSLPKRLPFICLETEVCNRDTWQYCDDEVYKRCRHCSDVEKYCWTPQMPLNCSIYCREQYFERQRVQGCPPLEPTVHGHHNGSPNGTKHSDVIVGQCDDGYQPVGRTSIECLDYGHYSGIFVCIEEKGPPPTHEKTFVLELIIVSILGGCGWVMCIAACLYICRQKQRDDKNSTDNLPLLKNEEPHGDGKSVTTQTVMSIVDEMSVQTEGGQRSFMTQRSRSETDPSTLTRHDESLNGDQGASSIPNVSPRGAAGGLPSPTNTPTSENSKDSGINIDLTQGNFNATINIINQVSSFANVANNREDPDKSTKETQEPPPKVKPKEPVNVKLSTEESGQTPKSCRAELDSDPDISDDGSIENVATERKTLHNSNSSLYINAVEEQEKDPVPQKAHVQAMIGKKGTDKVAIGTNDVGKSDVVL